MLRQIIFNRSVGTTNRALQYFLSTAVETKIVPNEHFRTSENNPTNHTTKNLGLYYTIPQDVKKALFLYGGFPKSFEKQIKTFGEPCLMIREPAIEIINYIKNSDFTKPVNRFVLYGRDGSGKSLILSHLLHFGYVSEYILVHVPWASNWFKRPKETGNSSSKEGFIDIPLDAAAWLIHFKNQNQNILSKLNLTTSLDYVWSKRETTPAGSTLLDLIDHGVNRIKFASDTVAALLSELKKSSSSGKCKTMVAIDGFNAFFHPNTRIFGENKTKIRADQITLTAPFVDITNYNWSNGVVILTVDRIAMTEERMESEMPRYLLGKQGFEHLDPFIPVCVENYTDKEYIRCIEYYLNRKWIQNTKPGFDNELKFLTGKNPFKLMEVCASL